MSKFNKSVNARIKKEIQELEQKTGVNLFEFLIKQLKRIEELEETEGLKDDDYIHVNKDFLKLMDEMKRIFKMDEQENEKKEFDDIQDLLFN